MLRSLSFRITFISYVFLFNTINAQVGIGTSNPNPSSLLEVNSANKGVLFPKIDLQSINDATTISNPANSLLIFNTGTTWGEASYYYNKGNETAPLWVKVNTSNTITNGLDVGYILGWAANTTPPDFLLPLNGGTFNKADFPELIALHATHPNQFIVSEDATTFTLKNINAAKRFLRGGSTAGVDEAMGTAAPGNGFTTDSQGSHAHLVDPPITWTDVQGNHNHSISAKRSGTGTENIVGNNNSSTANVTRYTNNAGAHQHSLDIASFWSTTNGAHQHNISGGDAETRPINTSVIWCIKAKSTGTAGELTINNNDYTLANISGAPDVKPTPHAQQATIAKGASLKSFDGINWEADIVEGYTDANVDFITPWGFGVQVGNNAGQQQGYIKNVSGASKWGSRESWYHDISGGSTGTVKTSTFSTFTTGSWLTTHPDDITLVWGGQEHIKFRWGNSFNDLKGNYEEYEVTIIPGFNFVQNFFRVKRLR